MSELARANGWRGFEGIGERVKGGYEYRCDGMPSRMGCGEDVTVPRAWTKPGVKKSRWLVCYGLNDDGTADLDVVLTFCPKCAAVVITQEHEPTESFADRLARQSIEAAEAQKHGPTDQDHTNRSQEEA